MLLPLTNLSILLFLFLVLYHAAMEHAHTHFSGPGVCHGMVGCRLRIGRELQQGGREVSQ